MRNILVIILLVCVGKTTATDSCGSPSGLCLGTPNGCTPSAILEVNSTTKTMTVPRMTTLQKQSIASPCVGLVVFDTDYQQLSMYAPNLQWILFDQSRSVNYDIQTYSTPGTFTWTKPANALITMVWAIGAGAGGDSSTIYTTDAVSGSFVGNLPYYVFGGDGAAAGTTNYRWLLSNELNTTETIVVGAGGTGGIRVNTLEFHWNGTHNDYRYTAPALGTAGGSSSFGSYVIAPGGPQSTASDRFSLYDSILVLAASARGGRNGNTFGSPACNSNTTVATNAPSVNYLAPTGGAAGSSSRYRTVVGGTIDLEYVCGPSASGSILPLNGGGTTLGVTPTSAISATVAAVGANNTFSDWGTTMHYGVGGGGGFATTKEGDYLSSSTANCDLTTDGAAGGAAGGGGGGGGSYPFVRVDRCSSGGRGAGGNGGNGYVRVVTIRSTS